MYTQYLLKLHNATTLSTYLYAIFYGGQQTPVPYAVGDLHVPCSTFFCLKFRHLCLLQ